MKSEAKNAFKIIEDYSSSNRLSFDGGVEFMTELEKLCLSVRAKTAQKIKSEEQLNRYKDTLINIHNVETSIDTDGVITVKMPLIMPFKKTKKFKTHPANLSEKYISEFKLNEVFETANVMIESLGYALDKLVAQFKINANEYKNSVLVYTSYFLSNAICADADNFEYKQLTDTVMSRLAGGDDNKITLIVSGRKGEESFTQLKIYPNSFKIQLKKQVQT